MRYEYEEPLMKIVSLYRENIIRTSTGNGLQTTTDDTDDVFDMTKWYYE